MILDGVAPLDWTIGPDVTGDAQDALNMLFANCKEDETCRSAFPDLEQEFKDILQQLSDVPVKVKLNHPSRGDEIDFTLNLENFTNTVHFLSYSQETAALLPLLIHQAAADDNFIPIAAQALITNETLSGMISPGMRYSVLCSEDVPFYPAKPASQGYLGNWVLDTFKQICKTWPAGEIPEDFKNPVQTDTPTLLISGAVDPVTPPENGTSAALTLPNSLHLIVPSQGHVNIYRGCIPKIATNFVDTASLSNLDTDCIEEIEPMPFFITVNGPQP
jgi:hypothetical protein